MVEVSKNKYFMLFSCCLPVKGANRSIICDLQRSSFMYINNYMFDFLSTDMYLADVQDDEDYEECVKVLDFLVEKEMGFYTENPENFPPINMKNNDYPDILKNVIIDFDKNSSHNLEDIISQISELRCQAVELRFYDAIEENKFRDMIFLFAKSTVRTLHVVLPSADWTVLDNLDKICIQYKRIKQIVVHGAAEDCSKKLDIETNIVFVTERINNETHCGNISPYYFQPGLRFFAESMYVNNCMHNKIGIDRNGQVKNCPSMPISFGNSTEVKLKDVLMMGEYKKYGQIKKDEIETCKDCEFRYICLDCRAYTSTTDDIYSKPQKCNYDPYSSKWS